MASQPLQIELSDLDSQSPWPWIIALIAGAGMLAMLAQSLQAIPASLERSANTIIQQASIEDINVVADGRDLILDGIVAKQVPIENLVGRLESIEGVRSVRTQLTVVDPVEQIENQRQQFISKLANIDISSVSFEPGSSSFSLGSEAALNQIATLMTEYSSMRIRIEGHTDNTGPEAVNLRISRDRAQAVANYLLDQGIMSDRLIARGYGPTQPIASNDTETGRAINRRIEISYVN